MSLVEILGQTMLVERLMGVGLYALAMLIACNYLVVHGRIAARKCLIVYAIFIGLMGFFYVPGADADLNRLLTYMHSWAEMPFNSVVDYALTTSTPVYVLYFWFIGQFGLDGLLPGITVFIGHILTFSCLWDYMNRIKIGNKEAAWSLAFLMSTTPFIGFVSGIRNSLAFSLVFVLMYRELVMEKGLLLHIPFYIAAALMHPAALAFVLIRFVDLLFERQNSRWKQLITVCLFVAFIAVAFRYGGPYIDAMLDKGSVYATGGTYSYIWEILIRAICLAFIVYAFLVWRRLFSLVNRDSEFYGVLGKNNLYRMVAILLIVSALSAFFGYTVFTRSVSFLTLFAPIVIMNIFKITEEKQLQVKSFSRVLKVTTVLLLLLSCSRGNMSGYKFFKFE